MSVTQRYTSLDLVRGISALLVCMSHLRATLFVDYAQQSRAAIGTSACDFITGLGHQSVVRNLLRIK